MWNALSQYLLSARSKLASIWYAYELQRRRPDLIVPVLHPGVINTDLADAPKYVTQTVVAALIMLTPLWINRLRLSMISWIWLGVLMPSSGNAICKSWPGNMKDVSMC